MNTTTRTSLLLLPAAALLCSACKESGEFAPGNSPALSRATVCAGKLGTFAGELYRDSQIAPIAPALYLSPREVCEIDAVYYVLYPDDDLGADNWYDKNKLHFENTKVLNEMVKNDPARATRILRAYERKAEQGNVNSLINAGTFYYQGAGAPKDVQKAMECFRKASASGGTNAHLAQYNIRFLQINDDSFTLADCLKALEADAANDTQSRSHGEQIYLLGKNKAKTADEQKLVREVLDRVMPKDKTGSCHYVSALFHRYGQMGVNRDEAQALKLYHESADKAEEKGGYSYAELMLGYVYQFGMFGQGSDEQKAQAYYIRAAATDDNLGMTDIAHRARTALAVNSLFKGDKDAVFEIPFSITTSRKDRTKPLPALAAAASFGDKIACYNQGIRKLIEAQGAMSPDIMKQIAQGEKCGQGNIEAAVRIYKALSGQGGTPTAADIETLRQNPTPAAQTLLGNCYALGLGVERNMAEAVRLYSAQQNSDPAARYNLGLCMEKGAGIERDTAKATELKKAATAEMGNAARS